MIITGERQLLQLKKMALSFLLICHQKEKEQRSFAGEKSLFFDMENEETEKFIAEIDQELKTIQS